MESCLDLLVPQAVDDGIAHGCDHRVDDRQHLVEVHGFDAAGSGIDEDSSRVEDPNHHQMRGAGGEAFTTGGG